MRMHWCKLAVIAALLGMARVAGAALIVDGGVLKGATGVDIGGATYDVTLVDDSCAAVFSGCDSVSDFDFTSKTDADAASQALLDQVLTGGFAAILGCDAVTNCRVYTPYAFSGAAALSSVAVNDPKGVSFNTVIPPFSLTNEPRAVWADWTKTAVSPPPPPNTTVPEPTPLLLLGTGIAGLAALRRRQRR